MSGGPRLRLHLPMDDDKAFPWTMRSFGHPTCVTNVHVVATIPTRMTHLKETTKFGVSNKYMEKNNEKYDDK
jgi:NADH:ubiquinone oxidoreductase subunit F (NADH-binding)